MNKYTLIALSVLLAVSTIFADSKREDTESRHAATLENSNAYVSKGAEGLDSEIKNSGFATCEAVFISVNNKGLELRTYNALTDEAIKTNMNKKPELVQSIRNSRVSGDEYELNPLQPQPVYAVTNYSKISRLAGSKIDTKYYGARKSPIAENLARSLNISRSNGSYNGATLADTYLSNAPTMILANNNDAVEDMLQQLKYELFDRGIDVERRNNTQKPILVLISGRDTLLPEVAPQIWSDLKKHYNITTLLDSEIREYFLNSRSAMVEAFEKKGDIKAQIEQSVTEKFYADFEQYFEEFNVERVLKKFSEKLWSNKDGLTEKALAVIFVSVIVKDLGNEDGYARTFMGYAGRALFDNSGARRARRFFNDNVGKPIYDNVGKPVGKYIPEFPKSVDDWYQKGDNLLWGNDA